MGQMKHMMIDENLWRKNGKRHIIWFQRLQAAHNFLLKKLPEVDNCHLKYTAKDNVPSCFMITKTTQGDIRLLEFIKNQTTVGILTC